MTSYTAEQRAEALALLADNDNSYATVRDRLGIPVGTLSGWVKQAGLVRAGSKQTEAATEERKKRIEHRRSRLAEKLLRYAENMADKADRTNKSVDAKNMMTAAAIALDKFRLEMGEATTVNEVRDSRPAEKVKAKVDELAERRQIRSA